MRLPEVWLRGPLPGIPPLVQPVAHALLQATEELQVLMAGFPNHLLWLQPAGMASAGFHLQHLTGVLDRLFTYARQEPLSEAQLASLQHEGTDTQPPLTAGLLVARFEQQVQKALQQLAQSDAATLSAYRSVGRAQLPTTLMGLYVHAAEHTMRHIGQLLVTVKVVRAKEGRVY